MLSSRCSARLGRSARQSVSRRLDATRGNSVISRSNRWILPSTTSIMGRSGQSAVACYTTERVLALRNKDNTDYKKKIMYDPTRETENCGVGMVASLKSIPSRRVVEDADEMLVRMSHRGGVGSDPASGDGAGKCCETTMTTTTTTTTKETSTLIRRQTTTHSDHVLLLLLPLVICSFTTMAFPDTLCFFSSSRLSQRIFRSGGNTIGLTGQVFFLECRILSCAPRQRNCLALICRHRRSMQSRTYSSRLATKRH